jgi:hypothetical protein
MQGEIFISDNGFWISTHGNADKTLHTKEARSAVLFSQPTSISLKS